MTKKSNDPKLWEKECVQIRRNIWQRSRRLDFFMIKSSDVILDLGCGDGLNMKSLLEKGTGDLTGIDVSKDLLAQAEINVPSAKLYLASAEKLPFKDNTFDVVLVDSVFHHLINSPKALTEIKRVLKKNGFLCFSEPYNSLARKIFDRLTFSPLALVIPYLSKRQKAYLAEKKNLEYWLKNSDLFIKSLEEDFQKKFLKYDLLSIMGKYQKI